MILTSEVDLKSTVLNSGRFCKPVRLCDYGQLLGAPTRSESPGPPPPYGHRNNVIHFYDHLGLLLREHHATCLIDGIEFLLEPTQTYFPTTSPYSGVLRVCGVSVDRSTCIDDLVQQCDVQFTPHLGRAWYADGESLSIQLETYLPAGPRSRNVKHIACVSVDFRGPTDDRPLMSLAEFSKSIAESSAN